MLQRPARHNIETDLPDDDDELNPPKSDRKLFITILVLNLVSGATTIQGIGHLLSGPVGWVGGIAVQSILLLLSTDKAARHAPTRKWLAMGVLTSVSIYTSFFSYYGLLTKDKKELNAIAMAVSAFEADKSATFTQLEQQILKLGGNVKHIEEQSKLEINGKGRTGLPGIGEEARQLAKKSEQNRAELNSLKGSYEAAKPLFSLDKNARNPEEIFKQALLAHAKLPAEYRKGAQQPQRADYIDDDLSVEFLAPINKLRKSENDAIAAVSIAILVDGMIVLLATAVSIKKRNSKLSIEGITNWASQILVDIKKLLRTLGEVYNQEVESTPVSDFTDKKRLENSNHLVSFQIRGSVPDFLTIFYHALDAETRIIDHQTLSNHPNPTYRLGYRMLIDELRRLRWIMLHPKKRCLLAPTQNAYESLTAWLGSEISRQLKEEEQLNSKGLTNLEIVERAITLALSGR